MDRRPVAKLSGPMNVRSTSLAVLAVVSTIYFLRIAQPVFIPVAIAIATACSLAPLVRWLRRCAHIPKPVGAATVLLLLCTLLGIGANSLQPQMLHILDVVPKATAKFSAALRARASDHNGALEKFNRAATEIQRAAAAAATANPQLQHTPAKAPPAAAAQPSIDVWDYVMMGTANAVAGFGQLVVVLALAFFLLISGDSFRLALIQNSGPSLARKKATLKVFAEIVQQIQRYLVLQVATSALLGVVIGIVFAALGLDNAVFWACCGALLHMIPYVGPAVFLVIVSMVAYVQFSSWVPVVSIVVTILLSTGIIGMLLVPWLTQRVSKLNTVTVFVSLLFWGWLWGPWGLLLGIPVMLALKVICEHTDGLEPIGRFLSAAPTPRRSKHNEYP